MPSGTAGAIKQRLNNGTKARRAAVRSVERRGFTLGKPLQETKQLFTRKRPKGRVENTHLIWVCQRKTGRKSPETTSLPQQIMTDQIRSEKWIISHSILQCLS